MRGPISARGMPMSSDLYTIWTAPVEGLALPDIHRPRAFSRVELCNHKIRNRLNSRFNGFDCFLSSAVTDHRRYRLRQNRMIE